jgi:hypothetical protein
MEPYPHHFSRRPKSSDSTNSSIRTMIDELQQMVQHLSEKVQGRCDGLEMCVDIIE